MLECSIITTEAGVEALADEWRALHARAGRNPVTDYDRFRAWWNTIGKGQKSRSLHVVAGRENGKLAGVLPFSVEYRNKTRMLQSDGGMAFECCGVLAENSEQAAALWQAARQSPHYDFAHIKAIFPDTDGYQALSGFARPRARMESFFVRFDWKDSKEWLASLSGNARGNFRRCTRRLEEKGPLKYSVYEGGPLPDAVIDSLVKQKLAWCGRRDKHGLFDHPAVGGYFRGLAESFARQENLFIAWMSCGEHVIAYQFGWKHRGTLHLFFWTYDPAWQVLSPGNVVMVNTIIWALDHGLKGIDFMLTSDSDSEKYFKKKYANEIRPCTEFTFSRSLYGRAMETMFVGKRALKKQLKNLKRRKAQKDEAA